MRRYPRSNKMGYIRAGLNYTSADLTKLRLPELRLNNVDSRLSTTWGLLKYR